MPVVLLGDPETRALSPRVLDPTLISNMSIADCYSNYFMNECQSDVTILVLNKNGQLQRLPGHRLVIKSGCPRFYEDMIRNTRSERCKDLWRWVSKQKRVVRTKEVKGCLSSPLLTILRFAYTRDIVLEPEFLLEVLRKGCHYFGEDHEFYKQLTSGESFTRLCQDYAWDYFRFADERSSASLRDAVLQVIDENALTLFPKREFRQLDVRQVKELVARDTLKIREADLFNACFDWASEACQRSDQTAGAASRFRLSTRLRNSKIFACTSASLEPKDGADELRRVMEPFLADIRFPLMSLEEFATGAFCSGVLSSQEVNDILSVILGRKVATRFKSKPRAFDNASGRVPTVIEKPSDGSRVTCKVCLDNEVSLVFVPCGHLVTCSSCADHLTDCPVCRKRITSRIRTFF